MLPTSDLCFHLGESGSDRSCSVSSPRIQHITDLGYEIYWVRGVENRNLRTRSLVLSRPDLNFVLMLNTRFFDFSKSANTPENFMWRKLLNDFDVLHAALFEFKSVFEERPLNLSTEVKSNVVGREGIFVGADQWLLAMKMDYLDGSDRALLPGFDFERSAWNRSSNYTIPFLLREAANAQRIIDIAANKDRLWDYLQHEACVGPLQLRLANADDLLPPEYADIAVDSHVLAFNGNANLPQDFLVMSMEVIQTDSGMKLKLEPFYDDPRHSHTFNFSKDNLVQLSPHGIEVYFGADGLVQHHYTEQELGFTLSDDYPLVVSNLVGSMKTMAMEPSIFEPDSRNSTAEGGSA